MKRRILLVDDEVAVLLTLKAILEISGFEVDTAASAKEAKSRLKRCAYAMVITDMRMENDAAGAAVIEAARSAEYHPAIALLTAFPVAEEDWHELETDKVEVLMKPMQTKVLLRQIENLLATHEAKLGKINDANSSAITQGSSSVKVAAKKVPAKKASAAKKARVTKAAGKSEPPRKASRQTQ